MSFHIPSFFKNKYFIALVVVLVWIAFFDKNNLIYQYKLNKQLEQLEDDKFFFMNEIQKDSTAIKELNENPESLEKFAREKYLMKKKNEDIFIIVED